MIFRTSLACALACLAVAGCTKVGTTDATTSSTTNGTARHAWTKPGVLRVGLQVAPNTLDPLLAANTTESMIGRLMFDVLVSADATGTHQIPILAQTVPTLANGGISKDGLTITYHLRKNVRWHDGAPFTSTDVKFTWSAILNKNNNVITHTGYELVRSVDTPDAYTAIFHMKKRFSPAVDTLFGESDDPYEILPEHLLGKLHDINTIPFNSAPIGTGPFKFKDWVHGEHVTVVRNDDYFLGKPKLERIVLSTIPDENTELNQLKTHDLDWQFEASPQQYKELKTMTEIDPILQDKNEYERIQINTTHPPLDDVRVRQALAYAIDRQKLVDALTFGSASVADQDHPKFMWAYAKGVPHYEHDLAKAKALLAEAGYVAGPDGDLTKNGQKLTLQLVTSVSNTTRRAGVVLVQAMLKEIGVTVDVKTYLGSMLFATKGQNGILQNGKFDLAWTGWVAGIDPDQSSIFTCAAQPPNGNNETHYCNPAMDAAQRDALDEYDRTARAAAYGKIETLLARDVPEIAIWWPRMIQPINPDFKHFTPNPVTESWNAYTWDI